MKTMSPRERRLVALAGLVALAAVAWLALIDPLVLGHFRQAEERARLRAQLDRDERFAAGLTGLRRLAEDQARDAGAFVLAAPTAALAGAALKEKLVAAATGGTVKSVQVIEPARPEPLVRVRAELRLTHSQLVGALRRLVDEAPYAVVESLSVVAERASLTGRAGPLEVALVVSAPLQPGAEQPRSAPAAAAGLRDFVRPCRPGLASRRRVRRARPAGAAAAPRPSRLGRPRRARRRRCGGDPGPAAVRSRSSRRADPGHAVGPGRLSAWRRRGGGGNRRRGGPRPRWQGGAVAPGGDA